MTSSPNAATELIGDEFIRQFEAGETPADKFHHADHVRLGFAYLCKYPTTMALERFSAALKKFAAAQGKAQRYHETITWAYLLLIREQMARVGQEQSWEEFAKQNPDMLIWKGSILDRFYTKATLDSELARAVFVFPDRMLNNDVSESGVKV
jgi:hypothetical protein